MILICSLAENNMFQNIEHLVLWNRTPEVLWNKMHWCRTHCVFWNIWARYSYHHRTCSEHEPARELCLFQHPPPVKTPSLSLTAKPILHQ